MQQASDGDQHASTSLVVRFPDGTKQFRFPNQMPEAGDALWHDGERYRVISVSADGNERSLVVESDSSTGDHPRIRGCRDPRVTPQRSPAAHHPRLGERRRRPNSDAFSSFCRACLAIHDGRVLTAA